MKLNKSEFTKLIEGLVTEMFEKRVQHLNEDDIALDNNLIIDTKRRDKEIEDLKKRMKNDIVKFVFRKKADGSYRFARGTTKWSIIKNTLHGGAPASPKVVAFYDLDKKEWRSFKPELFIATLN